MLARYNRGTIFIHYGKSHWPSRFSMGFLILDDNKKNGFWTRHLRSWPWLLTFGHGSCGAIRNIYIYKFSSRSRIPTIANLGSFGFSDILIHQEKIENPDFWWYLMSCFLVWQQILIFGKIDRLLSQQKRLRFGGQIQSHPLLNWCSQISCHKLYQIITKLASSPFFSGASYREVGNRDDY